MLHLRSRKKSKENHYSFRFTDETAAALSALSARYAAESKTDVVEALIEQQYKADFGHWPPKIQQEPPESNGEPTG